MKAKKQFDVTDFWVPDFGAKELGALGALGALTDTVGMSCSGLQVATVSKG